MTISIPPGVETGTQLRLVGEGEVGPGGGPAADLYVEISEEPHAIYTREGDDLHCTLSLPMTAAALGTTVELETLDGTEELHIHPGTQSGGTQVLKGRGVPHLRGTGRGNLCVHIDVKTPTALDTEQTALLNQLAELRGEQSPAIKIQPHNPAAEGGLFSKLRDAFTGRQ